MGLWKILSFPEILFWLWTTNVPPNLECRDPRSSSDFFLAFLAWTRTSSSILTHIHTWPQSCFVLKLLYGVTAKICETIAYPSVWKPHPHSSNSQVRLLSLFSTLCSTSASKNGRRLEITHTHTNTLDVYHHIEMTTASDDHFHIMNIITQCHISPDNVNILN